MIFSVRSHCFLPFSTILSPDPTVPPAAHGESTVAPLREIHVRTVLSSGITAVSRLYTSMILIAAMLPLLLILTHLAVQDDSYTVRSQARLCVFCYLAIAVAFWI